MGTNQKRKNKKKEKRGRTAPAYPFDFRFKIVKLYLEDGHSAKHIAEQFGISDFSVHRWSRLYREHGEQGLKEPAKEIISNEGAGRRYPADRRFEEREPGVRGQTHQRCPQAVFPAQGQSVDSQTNLA